MINISDIYTQKIILFYLVSDQGRKKNKRWNGGNLQRNTSPERGYGEEEKSPRTHLVNQILKGGSVAEWLGRRT